MTERTREAVLDELQATVAEEHQLHVRRAALAAEAWSLGAVQEDIAARLGVSQAAVSRLMRRPPTTTPNPASSTPPQTPGRPQSGMTERARLARMDPDLLGEIMRTTVADAVTLLQRSGRDQDAGDLARKARASRARNPEARITLIEQARDILKAAAR